MEVPSTTVSGSSIVSSEIHSGPVSEGALIEAAVLVPAEEAPAVVTGGEAAVTTQNGSGAVAGPSGTGVTVKKKRGRPRKFDENGNLHPSYMKPAPPQGAVSTTPASLTRRRVRRRRSTADVGSSHVPAAPAPTPMGELCTRTAGPDYAPQMLHVSQGEDVVEKIFSFLSNSGSPGVVVYTANGVISNVTIRPPSSAGATFTYEGRYEIISLQGSYTLEQRNRTQVRNGALSVNLADGCSRIVGTVAGMLRAAGPIQMVVGRCNRPASPRPEPVLALPAVQYFSPTPSAGIQLRPSPSLQSNPREAAIMQRRPSPALQHSLREVSYFPTYNPITSVGVHQNGTPELAMQQRHSADVNALNVIASDGVNQNGTPNTAMQEGPNSDIN